MSIKTTGFRLSHGQGYTIVDIYRGYHPTEDSATQGRLRCAMRGINGHYQLFSVCKTPTKGIYSCRLFVYLYKVLFSGIFRSKMNCLFYKSWSFRLAISCSEVANYLQSAGFPMINGNYILYPNGSRGLMFFCFKNRQEYKTYVNLKRKNFSENQRWCGSGCSNWPFGGRISFGKIEIFPKVGKIMILNVHLYMAVHEMFLFHVYIFWQ
jgi:hypothetical protein